MLKNERGATALEFAIILPILIILVFGIVEFGTMLFDQQVITNASREGARAGIVASSPRVLDTTIYGIVDNYAASHLVTFGTANSPNTSLTGYSSTAAFGDDLTVTVTYNFSFLVLDNILPGFGATRQLTATTVMKYE